MSWVESPFTSFFFPPLLQGPGGEPGPDGQDGERGPQGKQGAQGDDGHPGKDVSHMSSMSVPTTVILILMQASETEKRNPQLFRV